jgi:hypothetical protein
MIRILIENRDVFAWSVYKAPGVSPDLACHVLNIMPSHRPIVQKRRKLAPERASIVMEEVSRLLAVGAIREIQYPTWLSNTVVVKKKNGKWRMENVCGLYRFESSLPERLLSIAPNRPVGGFCFRI